jgi:uncharacterized protein
MSGVALTVKEFVMKDLRSRYGEFAVVTGASSGIGEQFSRQLAAAGVNVVMVARRKARLDALAAELSRTYGTTNQVIELDLLDDRAVEDLLQQTKDLDVGIVVANAGIYVAGPMMNNKLGEELDVLKLDAAIPLQLAHGFGQLFRDRRRGALILVSSTIAATAAPYLANYAAVKAYILSLGQALSYEMKKHGVHVLVISPGPTKTEGVDNAVGIDFAKLPVPMMDPDRVAKVALNSLGKRTHVVAGGANKFMDALTKFVLPRWLSTRMYGRLLRGALDESAR